jgi:peptidyl-prolyl cis-trans isomerase C
MILHYVVYNTRYEHRSDKQMLFNDHTVKRYQCEVSMATACARHILVKTKDEAEQLKQQLANGKDFGQLAKKYSLCKSSAKKGGDLGEFPPGRMVKAFDNVVFKKALLTVHGPVKTKFGFHLIETIYRS